MARTQDIDTEIIPVADIPSYERPGLKHELARLVLEAEGQPVKVRLRSYSVQGSAQGCVTNLRKMVTANGMKGWKFTYGPDMKDHERHAVYAEWSPSK